MKKIFGIISLFAFIFNTTPAFSQCGDCQIKYDLGKGPGEVFYGETIQGFINFRLSDGGNMKVPVGISMSDGSQVFITCQSSLNGYTPMKNASKCLKSNQYIEATLSWEAGYYGPISETWVPGHYEVVGWRVMEIN